MSRVFDLDPYERCGPLKRGLHFSLVQAAIGPAAKPFRKNAFAAHDALNAEGRFHVHFDAAGGCQGVEVFIGQAIAVTFAGRDLLTADASSFIETLIGLGQHWESDDYGIKAPMLGLATFHPHFDHAAGESGIDALYISLDPDFVP